jgi:hypothetical protein
MRIVLTGHAVFGVLYFYYGTEMYDRLRDRLAGARKT